MSVTSPLTIQGEANSVTSSVPLVAPGGQTGVQVPETQVTGTAYAGSQLLTAASNIDNSPYTLPVVQTVRFGGGWRRRDRAGAGHNAGFRDRLRGVASADGRSQHRQQPLYVAGGCNSPIGAGPPSGSSQFPASYNLVTLGTSLRCETRANTARAGPSRRMGHWKVRS